MKNKLKNYKISDEFNHFLESMWRLKKYRAKGIKSFSDLLRYGVLKTLESENKGILKQFKDIPEINEYLNPSKNDNTGIDEMKNKVEEYFKNSREKP